MKNLGGYTKVVHDCIDRALERLASSPRARRILEFSFLCTSAELASKTWHP